MKQTLPRDSRPHHGDVVAVEQDRLQLGDPPALWRALVLRHVLQHHVHEVVEPAECANNLLVVLHDDVKAGANTLVHQFCEEAPKEIVSY